MDIDPRTDGINWADDDYYGYSVWGRDEEDPWKSLVNTMTGIEIPTAHQMWFFMHSNVFESGKSVQGSVDAETGRMIHYLVSEGTTLANLF